MAFKEKYHYNSAVNVRQFAKIVDIRTKVISAGTLMASFSYAIYQSGTLRVIDALLMIAATLAIDMASTATNTYFDFQSGVDTLEKEREAQKVLVHEEVAAEVALFVALALFAFAGVLGVILVLRSSYLLLVAGLVSVAVGFGYTGGPFPIANTPFGEFFAGGFLGSVLFCITLFTQGIPLNGKTCLASLPLLLYIAMILSVNNVCDRVGDRESGRRTLAILLPERYLPMLIGIEGFGAFFSALVLTLFGLFPLSMLPIQGGALLIFGIKFTRARRLGFEQRNKEQQMGFATQGYLLLTLGFLLGHLFG